jgi:hypothetical protein
MFTPSEPFQRTSTDQDGFYRISNLAPGSYSITAGAPAFVMSDAKENRFKTVLVGDDENVESVNFALVRGGVITGRITDADGRPVIEEQVNVYPAEMYAQRVQRSIYAVGSVQTDDRGIYRVFSLSAGRYKVAVGRSDDELSVTYNQGRSNSYKQVFYPDVTDQAKATIVEVSEGSEQHRYYSRYCLSNVQRQRTTGRRKRPAGAESSFRYSATDRAKNRIHEQFHHGQ